MFSTFTTNYFRVVNAISIAKSNVVDQTMKKLKKKLVDFQSKYQLNLTSIIENDIVKFEEKIKLFLTLNEDFFDILIKRLKNKIKTNKKIKRKK